jgi:hypothetical protein
MTDLLKIAIIIHSLYVNGAGIEFVGFENFQTLQIFKPYNG